MYVKYPILIEHGGKDAAWGVIVPDLPGCFSASDNEADILNNAREAITLHLESLGHIPTPSKLNDIDANGLIIRQVEVELP